MRTIRCSRGGGPRWAGRRRYSSARAVSTMDTMLSCGPDELARPAWWHALAEHCRSTQLAQVTDVEPREGTVVQSNCVIRRYRLHIENSDHVSVVIKQVQLAQNKYRDEEHRSRSLRSYQVERGFYGHVAPLLRERGVPLPALLAAAWSGDCMRGVAVMEDLACPPGHDADAEQRAEHGRSLLQRLALGVEDARHALAWLAGFHAACWVPPAEGAHAVPDSPQSVQDAAEKHLWPHGGYWSLDKRHLDLAGMPEQWRRWQDAMLPDPDSHSTQHSTDQADADIAQLAARLQAAAPALAQRLDALGATSGHTMLHGDFKTANIFFQPAPPDGAGGGGAAVRVCPCDFQWAGAGLGMQDVAYLLWTSVDPAALAAHEGALLRHYHDRLHSELAAAGVSRGPTDRELQEQYEVAMLDYVRFLVGSMWGACTPASFDAKAGDINQGMHKRDRRHHMRMVRRALRLLQRHSAWLPAADASRPGFGC
eukprot:jgi/Ulvmu1/10278/UM060_0080.1